MPLPGQTGVINLNSFYFAVYLQTYCLTSYETLLNYSLGLFRPSDMAFLPLLAFQDQFYHPKWLGWISSFMSSELSIVISNTSTCSIHYDVHLSTGQIIVHRKNILIIFHIYSFIYHISLSYFQSMFLI